MALGQWFKRLGIPAQHSTKFHQRRPQDYHARVLDEGDISFHNILSNADWKEIYRLLTEGEEEEKEEL